MPPRNHTTINIENKMLTKLTKYCGKKYIRSAVLTEALEMFFAEKAKDKE